MNKSQPRVVITGSTGFLGTAVTLRLKSTYNYHVLGLAGRRQWDLTNQKMVDYAFQELKPDYIIHLAAACGGIGINRDQPGKFLYDNLSMGMNLIETAKKYGKLKNLIMIGTVCSYPKITPVPFKEENLWNGYPEETNAPYGIAKKTLIEMLIAYNRQYGLNSTNLIPVNMYGPYDNFNPISSHVIPALILKIDKAKSTKQKEIELWGTGNASREFLYVDDCADVICRSLEAETTPLPINVGTGEEIKICELAELISGLMGYDGKIIYNSKFPDGQPRRCLDTSKAYEIFGFKAKTGLYLGLKDTINWYYKNKQEKRFEDFFSYIQ
jgi:GDP-L-fucose synthase